MQENLTAWVDGELSRRWEGRVRRHLATCPSCAAEAGSLRATIERQSVLLARATAVADFAPGPMAARLQGVLAEYVEERSWGWTLRPFAVAGAALAVAIVVLFFAAGGPRAILIPLGVQSPPPAVSRSTDMFKEYPIIERLEALENFDTVESVPLDDDQEPQRG